MSMYNKWVPVMGYEGHYEINKTGIIRSLNRKISHVQGLNIMTRNLKSRIISTRINNKGYVDVRLSKNGISKTFLLHKFL